MAGLTRVHVPNGISIGSAVSAGLTMATKKCGEVICKKVNAKVAHIQLPKRRIPELIPVLGS